MPNISKNKEQPKKKYLKYIIIAFVVLIVIYVVFFSLFAVFLGKSEITYGENTALIRIDGIISIDSGSSLFEENTASSSEIANYIEEAEKDDSIKAVLFVINSPGGSPVATKEIASAIKKITKPKVALIREVGASGGYWVASASDYIIADEMSITGSIGVISSYLEFSGLLNKYNISYQRLVSGKYKDLGDPFKKLSNDEYLILESKIKKIHNYFVKAVAENRNIPEEDVKKIATGEFYLGAEAFDLGLIDELGNKDTAINYLKKKANLAEVSFKEYKRQTSFLDLLANIIAKQSFFLGKGIGSSLIEEKNPGIFELNTN